MVHSLSTFEFISAAKLLKKMASWHAAAKNVYTTSHDAIVLVFLFFVDYGVEVPLNKNT